MKERNDLWNRPKVYALRVFLAAALLLVSGLAGAKPTLTAAAEGLAQETTSGLPSRSARFASATVDQIDHFPGAEISSIPYQDLDLDISTATSDVDDPTSIVSTDCNSNEGEASVWYSYNPGGQNAYLSLDTLGSDYDTLIAVWTGDRGNLSLVACDDDISLDQIRSRVKLFAEANTTYYIEIIKFAGPTTGIDAQGNTLDFHIKKINYELNPPSINFGNQLYRNWTAIKTVTYTNYDVNPIQLGTLSITDSYPARKTMVIRNNTCSNGTLNYGESCTFGVAFRPWVAGAVTGKVTIPSDAPDQPYYLNLKGNGILGTALIKNFSFEMDKNKDKLPDLWSFRNLTPGRDVLTSQYSHHRNYSMRLVGENPRKAKTLTQVIYKKGVAGDDFYVQGWSRAVKAPTQGVRFFVYWYNGTKLVGRQTLVWKKGTYNFKTLWKAYTAPAKYTRIVVKISYLQTSGTVWMDQVILRWAPSPK